MYKNYEDLLEERLSKGNIKKNAVVAGANDVHVLEAVFQAQSRGYIFPVLVGEPAKIKEVLEKEGFLDREYTLVEIDEGENPAIRSVELIHEGVGDFLIKGKIETRDLLKPVLDKEKGLNKEGFITHFGLMQLAGYHKLLAMSDSAVIPYPTLEDKEKIVKACVRALHTLGYEKPIIAPLCAVEVVNPKMPETIDANILRERAEQGLYGMCKILGPISYDLATSKESAQIKGYMVEEAGNVDMLLVPQMVTGNVMSKIWNVEADNILAGCLIGADVPIVLTSRSASANEKLYSILLCNLLSKSQN